MFSIQISVLNNNSVEKNISIEQPFFFFTLTLPGIKNKKVINIGYLIIVLITWFLVSMDQLVNVKYQYTIGCRISFSDTDVTFLIPGVTMPVRQGYNRSLTQFTFQIKYIFIFFILY